MFVSGGKRRIVILIEGAADPLRAKTAASVVRYRREEVAALLDSTRRGETAEAALGVGGDLPVVGSLAEVPEADALLIGVAPPGGKLPAAMRAAVRDALRRGMAVISGLHDFLADDPEFAAEARAAGAEIIDVRKSDEREVANRQGIDERCLRIHTVGNDCSVGKMVAALEIARGLARRGRDAKFVATGQTGIMVEGDGCPIDGVVVDFVNGAAEKLVLANQHHEILLIEGQGSLVHPRYSAVTLGLLHGAMPDGLVLCYEVGRATIRNMPHMAIPPLDEVARLYETMARVMHPCRVIGVAMNSRRLADDEADAERARVRRALGLPVCDALRHGPDELIDAVLRFQQEVGKGR
jgi:uncharacterized NAD-dependent epimerase/dehydratase family protein